jgi:catechol 2,3-dioxygenase-like lactoylglutathione lyase family enzyme
VLGLQVNKRWFEDDGSPRSVWLDSGRGSFIALEKATPGFEATAGAFHEGPPGWFVLALAIRRSSRSAWEDRLRAAGVKIQRRTPYTLFFRDPDGNRIGLSHYPDAAPLTGG